MKRWTLRLALVATAVLGVVCLLRLLPSGGPLPGAPTASGSVACTIVGATNDASGTSQIMFQLTNPHSASVLVGLDGIEVMDSSGWHKVRDEHGRVVAGIAPNSSKTFMFPEWTRRSPWRLRLMYNPPSSPSLLEGAVNEVELRMVGRASGEAVIVLSPTVNR